MSIPISNVGVATKTFGAEGSVAADLKASSYSKRVLSSRSPVCSRATNLRMDEER